MTKGATERLIGKSHRELERTMRAAGAAGVLAGLLWPFDNRRRKRDTLALRESARALKRLWDWVDRTLWARFYMTSRPKGTAAT